MRISRARLGVGGGLHVVERRETHNALDHDGGPVVAVGEHQRPRTLERRAHGQAEQGPGLHHRQDVATQVHDADQRRWRPRHRCRDVEHHDLASLDDVDRERATAQEHHARTAGGRPLGDGLDRGDVRARGIVSGQTGPPSSGAGPT